MHETLERSVVLPEFVIYSEFATHYLRKVLALDLSAHQFAGTDTQLHIGRIDTYIHQSQYCSLSYHVVVGATYTLDRIQSGERARVRS